jgi:membrane dipeptidase
MADDKSLKAARDFLKRVSLVDGHNDMPYVMWKDKKARGDVRLWDARKLHPETDTDIPRLRDGLVSTQIFTAFIQTFEQKPLKARLECIDTMLQLEQLYPDVFHPVLDPRDIKRAKKAGKIGLFKAVEGLTGVDRVGHLRLFHAIGIRLVTLCHNENLPFVGSATDAPVPEPLTDFGREIIAEMERLGLIIDMAHVSAEAQHKVIDAAKGPVMISHACARALCAHPRNVPDDVMKRIADRGGIVMATFIPAFLSQKAYEEMLPAMDGMGKAPQNADPAVYNAVKEKAFVHYARRDGIDHLAEHLDHMVNVMGIEGVGIGSDFYGGPMPPGLKDVTCFPALFARLMKKGWKTRALEKLAGGNFERLWKDVYRADVGMA